MAVPYVDQDGTENAGITSGLADSLPVVGQQVFYKAPAPAPFYDIEGGDYLEDRMVPALIVGTEGSLGLTPVAPYVLDSVEHVHLLVFALGSACPIRNVPPGADAGEWSYPSGS